MSKKTGSYHVYFEGLKVTYYTLKGDQAMVLELTAGKYGYPGYSPLVEVEIGFAMDPLLRSISPLSKTAAGQRRAQSLLEVVK